MQAGLQDILQSAGIIENDRQIKIWSGEIRERTGRIDQSLVEIEELGKTHPKENALGLIRSLLK